MGLWLFNTSLITNYQINGKTCQNVKGNNNHIILSLIPQFIKYFLTNLHPLSHTRLLSPPNPMPIIQQPVHHLHLTINNFILIHPTIIPINTLFHLHQTPSPNFIHQLLTIITPTKVITLKLSLNHSMHLLLPKYYYIFSPHHKKLHILHPFCYRTQQLPHYLRWTVHVGLLRVKVNQRIVCILTHLGMLTVVTLLMLWTIVPWNSSRRIYRPMPVGYHSSQLFWGWNRIVLLSSRLRKQAVSTFCKSLGICHNF